MIIFSYSIVFLIVSHSFNNAGFQRSFPGGRLLCTGCCLDGYHRGANFAAKQYCQRDEQDTRTSSPDAPPAACFAQFRWEDCGQAPVPVMYYWRPGSRCEVGIWRGCLPNLNMFPDEYECVATCIYTSRASAADYHVLNAEDVDNTESDIELDVATDNATDVACATEADNATVADSTGATTISDVGIGNSTVMKDEKATTVAAA